MREALASCEFRDPKIPVVANVTGRPHEPGTTAELLIEQLVSPVKWVRSMDYLIASGFGTFVEAGPGKVLTGLFRDIQGQTEAFNVQDMGSLSRLKETVEEPRG